MENATTISTITVLGGNTGAAGHNGQNGVAGLNSVQNKTGQNGTDGSCTSKLFGVTCHCATNGTAGANAPAGGQDGTVGGPGTDPYVFILRVDTFLFPNDGELTIMSQGGDGGPGGAGGAGGDGAPGGNAGNTTNGQPDLYRKKCLNSQCGPAKGGHGGDGGYGGRGGPGGPGGNGGQVTIYYKNGNNINQVVVSTPAGAGGQPGAAGLGGKGGAGGLNEPTAPNQKPTPASAGNNGPSLGTQGGGMPGQPGSIVLRQLT